MDQRTLRLLEYDKVRALVGHHAATTMGREIIARMRPVRDAALARARLGETAEARTLLEERIAPPFGGIRDVRDALKRAEKEAVLTAQELLDVAETAAASRRLRRTFLTVQERTPALQAQAVLLGEFSALEQAIDKAISATGEVQDNASPELARARRQVRTQRDGMRTEMQRLVSAPHMQDLLQEPIITQRNGRYCVPVRAESRNAIQGIVHDISASGQTIFMEPMPVVNLGNDLREAERKEEEEVYRVLATLSAQAGKVADRLLTSLDAASRLDAIFARAYYAQTTDAVMPDLNNDGIVDLKKARHPLLGSDVVPIDITVGEETRNTLVITGPNTGGKTVTLKTVGLFSLMAQSGLHVPADGARLPAFDQVFADIGDEQSIEQSLSTFSSHMTAIVRIVTEAGPNALVLFDEIGAGTDPAEGAALAKSILLELNTRGCRTLATTHYGELKIFAQTTEGFDNASVEFDLETLRPTYRILTGLPGSSYAFAIAQRLGLPKPLIQQAKTLLGETPQAIDQVLKQAEGARRAHDRERTAAAQLRRESEQALTKLQREQQDLETRRDAILARAREQAQQVVEKARMEAGTLLEELRTTIREQREHAIDAGATAAMRKKARQVLGDLADKLEELPAKAAPQPEPQKPALSEVSAGQSVYVRSLKCRGTALSAGQGDEEVGVQVGIMQVRVPVSDLEAVAPTADEYRRLAAAAHQQARAVAPEIRLLGKRAEEAATELEEYLYDALEGGVARVRVIHGFGTGALRNVVQDVLRHHPAVRRYQQAEPQEGGGGATIVELGKTAGA